ncbi:MAG: dTDP-4-amino-4,6-dideoxygalactose transaminase [Anaerolineaceae bacterium]|nr:dTDP-4-amino-4,6-dideoxygalactose transaminase [Anaerolineaceae bacterium]
MVDIRIPFNKPAIMGNEMANIQQAVTNGHISGDGPFSKQVHKQLQETFGVERVLLTTSCTHALEMSALLLDIRPGDEVIVPSYTFVSTINAFALRGAKPVFVDVRWDTKNLDETHLEQHITHRTKAIVPVHYAGVGCEMDTIMSIARKHGISVVEDNAQGLYGKYKGQWLGTFGEMSTVSFHETKNIQCGEGGALFINDKRLVERAEIIREKGTNRSRYFRGQVDKYTWVDIGSSYLPSDMLAAYLQAQLEVQTEIYAARERVWNTYDTELAAWAEEHGVERPYVPNHVDQTYHMYYLVLPSLEVRTRLQEHLRKQGIVAVFHYQPLHLSEMGKQYGGQAGDAPVTEKLGDQLLRLPFYNTLTESEQSSVIQALLTFEEW